MIYLHKFGELPDVLHSFFRFVFPRFEILPLCRITIYD